MMTIIIAQSSIVLSAMLIDMFNMFNMLNNSYSRIASKLIMKNQYFGLMKNLMDHLFISFFINLLC